MTKEETKDIAGADPATAAEAGKVSTKPGNDDIAAVSVVKTDTVSTDKTATGDNVGHEERGKSVDEMSSSIEKETAKLKEDSAATDSTVMNEGDDKLKADTTVTEANSFVAVNNSIAASGDVELTANFPQKLMEILSNEEYAEIIHWLPHGKGFIIANKKRFGDEVLPKYFKKAKFTSFTRKLNRWNFVRITRGPEVGSYYHPNFQKDNLKLVSQMTCIGSKQPQAVKPLDPIALGVVPMGEPIDAATEALGGIHQWQRQDHERYRLFYQQNHWNYMMQMMQQATAAKSQSDPDAAVITDATAAAEISEANVEESTDPLKMDVTTEVVEGESGETVVKVEEKKVETDTAGEEQVAAL